jgi:hypothetical protein
MDKWAFQWRQYSVGAIMKEMDRHCATGYLNATRPTGAASPDARGYRHRHAASSRDAASPYAHDEVVSWSACDDFPCRAYEIEDTSLSDQVARQIGPESMDMTKARRLGATIGIGAILTSIGVLAGCANNEQPTTPTTSTTTTTTSSSTTPTEKGLKPGGSNIYTPGPPPHSNGVAEPAPSF